MNEMILNEGLTEVMDSAEVYSQLDENIDSGFCDISEAYNESIESINLLTEFFNFYSDDILNEVYQDENGIWRTDPWDDFGSQQNRTDAERRAAWEKEMRAQGKDPDVELENWRKAHKGTPAPTPTDAEAKNSFNRNNNNSKVDNTDKIRQYLLKFANMSDGSSRPLSSSSADSGDALEYRPEVAVAEVERIQDMKFPKNIIYFLKYLISWIKKLIINFITKASNIIKMLLGVKKEDLAVPESVKFNLDDGARVKPVQFTGSNAAEGAKGLIKLYNVSPRDIYDISKQLLNENELTNELNSLSMLNEDNDGKYIPAIQIDLTTDLMDLSALIEHFFKIFDSAYGSNNEYLFGTDDVEMLLKVFNKAIEDIEAGALPNMEVAGKNVMSGMLDKDALKTSLSKTATNTDQLKRIFTDILDRIQKTLKKITSKELLASSDLGGAYKFYSISTYNAMKRLTDIIKPRLKRLETMQKDMEAIRKKYEKVVNQLGKLQQSFAGMTSLAYQTHYQKIMNDLFVSSRVVTQIITLRLTTLNMSIKAIKDTYEAISIANAVNKRSLKQVVKQYITGKV